ncbi:MAG: cysteine desulfuration protein SufE [Rhodothermales bacterium]|jgi:cysteine desulfuration protein SufE
MRNERDPITSLPDLSAPAVDWPGPVSEVQPRSPVQHGLNFGDRGKRDLFRGLGSNIQANRTEEAGAFVARNGGPFASQFSDHARGAFARPEHSDVRDCGSKQSPHQLAVPHVGVVHDHGRRMRVRSDALQDGFGMHQEDVVVGLGKAGKKNLSRLSAHDYNLPPHGLGQPHDGAHIMPFSEYEQADRRPDDFRKYLGRTRLVLYCPGLPEVRPSILLFEIQQGPRIQKNLTMKLRVCQPTGQGARCFHEKMPSEIGSKRARGLDNCGEHALPTRLEALREQVEYVDPGVCRYRLDEHMNHTVASRTEPKNQIVFAQREREEAGLPFIEYGKGLLGDFALQAAARNGPPGPSSGVDQHASPRPAIRRAADLDHRRHNKRLSSLVESFGDSKNFQEFVHVPDMLPVDRRGEKGILAVSPVASEPAPINSETLTMLPALSDTIEMFASLEGAAKLELLIDFGEQLPVLDEPDARLRDSGQHMIHECQSPVFLVVRVQNGALQIRGDAPREAPIARGFTALLCEIMDGATMAELRATPTDLLSALGLHDLLSLRRRHGLSAIWQHVREFAVAN